MVLVYLLARTLDIFCWAAVLLMLARSILSFVMFDIEDNPLMNFVYAVTDVITAPVRIICERMGWFTDLPIDMPHMITFLLIVIIQSLIPTVAI